MTSNLDRACGDGAIGILTTLAFLGRFFAWDIERKRPIATRVS
jgi:hypothetical protein